MIPVKPASHRASLPLMLTHVALITTLIMSMVLSLPTLS